MNRFSEYKSFKVELTDGVELITINCPESRNALSIEGFQELLQLISLASADPEVRVIVLTGAGDRAFCSGMDVSQMMEAVESGQAMKIGYMLEGTERGQLKPFEECNKPIIAAMNGAAFGGGFEIALACDIRIVAEHISMGLPEIGLGIMPGSGGTHRLSQIVGLGVAKEIILAGRVVQGPEAPGLGLALKCVPKDKVLEEAMKVAGRIAQKAPIAVQLAKHTLNLSASADRDTGLMIEKLAFSLLMHRDDRVEGFQAFSEKRKPNFTGN